MLLSIILVEQCSTGMLLMEYMQAENLLFSIILGGSVALYRHEADCATWFRKCYSRH